MKQLVAFDLDGTLAESKQPLGEPMGRRWPTCSTSRMSR